MNKSSTPLLRRRQFLANLLFAGGALTFASLQGAAAQLPIEDGWVLPPDLERRLKNKTGSRMDPVPEPTEPSPPPADSALPPPTRPQGGLTPSVPPLPGGFRLPPDRGKVEGR
jgi:hypothetical protein